MRKLITSLQVVSLTALLTNAGLLIYISIYSYIDPLWYLIISGSVIQNNLYSYSLWIGLYSFIISLILYFIFKKKFSLRIYLLITPAFIFLVYFIYFLIVLVYKSI